MGMPPKGLYFEDGRKKLLKYKTALSNPNMRDALIDDIRLAEGEAAAREVTEEFTRKRLMNDRVQKRYRHSKSADVDKLFKNSCDPHGLRK